MSGFCSGCELEWCLRLGFWGGKDGCEPVLHPIRYQRSAAWLDNVGIPISEVEDSEEEDLDPLRQGVRDAVQLRQLQLRRRCQ